MDGRSGGRRDQPERRRWPTASECSMELPNDSIGVSDLKGWQECPRRMSYEMKRHTGVELPEARANPHTRYGTAVHDGIQHMEDTQAAPEEVVQFLISDG